LAKQGKSKAKLKIFPLTPMGGYVNSFGVLRTTLKATEEQHGQIVNYTKLGRKLLISAVAAKQRVKCLEEEGLVLLLPALTKSTNKKRVTSARLYLQGSPIEEIINQEELRHPSSRFFHYTKYSGLTVDLIVERAEYRFGIQINLPDSNYMRSHRPICSAVMEGVVKRGFVLHSYYRAFFSRRDVVAFPFLIFLSLYEELTEEKKSIQDMRIFMRWITSYTGRR